jgi:hypothetical protein
MQPSLSKFIKITPCFRATKLVNFQIISTLSNESWNKILPSMSQAFTTQHTNVFTLILSLSEGRAGIAWVPSNKMLFFPLRYKAPLAFSQMFSLYFYSYTILSDSRSLSLATKGWVLQLTPEKSQTVNSHYAVTWEVSQYWTDNEFVLCGSWNNKRRRHESRNETGGNEKIRFLKWCYCRNVHTQINKSNVTGKTLTYAADTRVDATKWKKSLLTLTSWG